MGWEGSELLSRIRALLAKKGGWGVNLEREYTMSAAEFKIFCDEKERDLKMRWSHIEVRKTKRRVYCRKSSQTE